MTDLNVSRGMSSIMLPPALAEALGFMQRLLACPDEVKARIASLRVPAEEVTGTRVSTNWRPSGGGAGGPSRTWGHAPSRGGYQSRPPGRRPDRALAPRFGNKARADVTTEERMMDRIRDKMNKFSAITYDATKSWLSQLLDSGEAEFLTEFIALVFEKAASEPTFCALYARLITELRSGFPHLDSEVQRIFGEFMDIFVEAAVEPTADSVEYKMFVALRERRRYRRGYAAFVGEVARLKVLTTEDVTRTCDVILDGLLLAKAGEDKQMLCEEYADCLTALIKSSASLLKPVAAELKAKVTKAMDRTGAPSLTNKARFALMDVGDLL